MESNARRDLALRLLTEAVAAAGTKGKAAVAVRLGKGRSLLSRVLSPNDPLEMSEKLADRVIDTYHVIPVCPATGKEQPRAECFRFAQGKAPMHNPMAMQTWKKCQSCPHSPKSKQEGSNQ